jgi:hypothetical protein
MDFTIIGVPVKGIKSTATTYVSICQFIVNLPSHLDNGSIKWISRFPLTRGSSNSKQHLKGGSQPKLHAARSAVKVSIKLSPMAWGSDWWGLMRLWFERS